MKRREVLKRLATIPLVGLVGAPVVAEGQSEAMAQFDIGAMRLESTRIISYGCKVAPEQVCSLMNALVGKHDGHGVLAHATCTPNSEGTFDLLATVDRKPESLAALAGNEGLHRGLYRHIDPFAVMEQHGAVDRYCNVEYQYTVEQK